MPPSIRLTCLGIRQVPQPLIEAAEAFGATRSQRLFKVELPLALPTIMSLRYTVPCPAATAIPPSLVMVMA